MAEDPIHRWLLEGDASIRWQTMSDLLDARSGKTATERDAVSSSGWGKQLLERQDPEGTWAQGLYGPKWTSTTYTLLLLYRLGLPQHSPAAIRGVELLWDGARYFDGGLTPAKSIDAPEGCVTAMYVMLAKYFGYGDSRVDVAIDWMLHNQLDDGGWNCRNVRFGDTHSSFHTSISTLEALAEVHSADPGGADITDAIGRGQEFFLAHHLYQSHRTGGTASAAFTRLSFPPRWHYDVLRGLDHFQATAAPWDERLGAAIDLLDTKQRSDGTWPVQQKHAGKTWFTMERTGGPSRWNTLRALRVLRWADRG